MTGGEIAIVGISGRFPGARNVSEFWENLKAGRESILASGEDAAAAADGNGDATAHWVRVNSLLKAVDSLHMNGIKVFTSEMGAAKKVFELDLAEPCCIVMGSEDKGVQSYIRKAADEHFTIPMTGDFDSLNVSVAAGIILYEAMKQRLP